MAILSLITIGLIAGAQAINSGNLVNKCGHDKSGKAIVCVNGKCVAAPGTYNCAPLDATICQDTNAVTNGLFCPVELSCYDTKNCIDNDGKTLPASTPAPGTVTDASVVPTADRTVYGDSQPTTTSAAITAAGKTVYGDSPPSTTATAVAKPNTASSFMFMGRESLFMAAAVVAGILLF